MRVKKILIAVSLVFAAALLSFVILTVAKLIRIAPNYRAKVYCSCRFVTEQSHDFCEVWTKNPLMPNFMMPLEHDDTAKFVGVKNFLNQATARYLGPEEGCRLD